MERPESIPVPDVFPEGTEFSFNDETGAVYAQGPGLRRSVMYSGTLTPTDFWPGRRPLDIDEARARKLSAPPSGSPSRSK